MGWGEGLFPKRLRANFVLRVKGVRSIQDFGGINPEGVPGADARLPVSLINGLGDQVRFMRDPTRGGLAAVLVEIASAAGCSIEIEESAIPLDATAHAAAELLGLDLLTVANEGKLVAVVSAEAAQQAAAILRDQEIAATAAVVGTVGPKQDNPLVEMLTTAGGRRNRIIRILQLRSEALPGAVFS